VSLSCGTLLISYLLWAQRDSARKGMTRAMKWPQKREGWRWGEKRGRSKKKCHAGTKREKVGRVD